MINSKKTIKSMEISKQVLVSGEIVQGDLRSSQSQSKPQMIAINIIGPISNENQQRQTNFKQIVRKTLHEQNKKKKITRKCQHPLLYLFTLLLTILMGTQNLYLFLWKDQNKGAIYIPTALIRIVFFLYFGWSMCLHKKVMLKLYLALDRVLLTMIAQWIAIIGFTNVNSSKIQQNSIMKIWTSYVLCVLYPLVAFTFAGYYRVLLVYVDWKPFQIVIFKLFLLLGGVSHFSQGLYYTIFLKDQSEEINEYVKNFLVLFAFAGFDFYLESFALIEQTDGTTKLKFRYRLKCNEEDMDILLHGGIPQLQPTFRLVQSRPINQIPFLTSKKVMNEAVQN